MDVLLLGALAVVLIAITVWIVMWPSRAPAAPGGAEDAAQLTPQGDRFEDQYTSATADLSAGAVATTLAHETREEAVPVPFVQPRAIQPAEPARPRQTRATFGLFAGALLTLGGAIGGAWLYSRWQRERNKPVSRIKRRLIR